MSAKNSASDKTEVERLYVLLLRPGATQELPLSSLLFIIVLEVLAKEISQENDTKCIQICNEDIKLLYM